MSKLQRRRRGLLPYERFPACLRWHKQIKRKPHPMYRAKGSRKKR